MLSAFKTYITNNKSQAKTTVGIVHINISDLFFRQ